MRAATIDPLADERWSAAVERSADASVFHHPAWLGLIHDQYGYETSATCLVDDDGSVMAGLPLARIASRLTGRRLVALPFSDFCPPLLGDDAPDDAVAQLAAAVSERRAREGLAVEVHEALPGVAGGELTPACFHHRLALEPDVDAVVARFSKSQVRRGISRAQREGLTAERATDRAALDAFYALHVLTRRKLGVPVQPKRFIRAFERLFAAGLGFVLLVRSGPTPVAAAVFLGLHGVLTYKYGASDPAALGRRPNNLLFMEAIRWGCENGYRELDFGRTELDNDGLRKFKRAWGAEETEVSYTYAPPRRPGLEEGPAARVLSAAIRRGPKPLGRRVGEVLYRHFG